MLGDRLSQEFAWRGRYAATEFITSGALKSASLSLLRNGAIGSAAQRISTTTTSTATTPTIDIPNLSGATNELDGLIKEIITRTEKGIDNYSESAELEREHKATPKHLREDLTANLEKAPALAQEVVSHYIEIGFTDEFLASHPETYDGTSSDLTYREVIDLLENGFTVSHVFGNLLKTPIQVPPRPFRGHCELEVLHSPVLQDTISNLVNDVVFGDVPVKKMLSMVGERAVMIYKEEFWRLPQPPSGEMTVDLKTRTGRPFPFKPLVSTTALYENIGYTVHKQRTSNSNVEIELDR